MKNKSLHLLGYTLLGVIIYLTVDLNIFIENLGKISLGTTVILVLIATVDRFVMAAKWQHLCSVLNFTTDYFQYLKIYYAATFLGYFLPTSIGGEIYKAARLSRFEKSHDVLASMFIEKIIGVFSTVSFAWIGVLYISFTLHNENASLLFYLLTGFTFIAIFITWASLHTTLQSKVISFLEKFQADNYIKKFSAAYSNYKNHSRLLFLNFVFAIFESALQLIIMCGIGLALDINIALPLLAAIIAITEFIRRIAIILDGWGLATALQIFMYGLVGISTELALLIALLSHAVHLIASAPGGLIALSDRWDKK